MTELKEKHSSKDALFLGAVCTAGYAISYYVRKLLGNARPEILEQGIYTAENLDHFQSLYLVFYALGQFVFGIIGDYIKPSLLLFLGFFTSGASLLVFSLSESPALSLLSFALLGAGLSMIRGPLMRIIIENTEQKQARIICAVMSFFNHFSVFFAAVFLMIFKWREAFLVSGIFVIFTGLSLCLIFTGMKKKDRIVLCSSGSPGKKISLKEIFSVFRLPDFVYYIFIGGICEIACTTIIYWLPSFFCQYFGQSESFSNLAVSIISIGMAFCAMLTLFLFRIVKERTERLTSVLFLLSLLSFIIVLFSKNLYLSLILLALGLVCIGCVAQILWVIYLPSLGKTGKISGANGVLDCCGYLIASGGNAVFSFLMVKTGWTGIQIAWIVLCVLGLFLGIFKFREPKEE